MPKLPVVSGQKLIKALKKAGFRYVSQKGDHTKLQDDKGRVTTVPDHKEIKKGTIKNGILNPLGITVGELIKLLK